MTDTYTANATLIIWIFVSIGLFAVMRPNRALVIACVVGWLLLPRAYWNIDKVLAANFGMLVGALIFAPHKFIGYKFSIADLALVAFCGGTFVTSIVNGLGLYDGISSFARLFIRYGVPYFLGRAFLRTREDFYDAARIIVLGSAAYALLAVWEWRMSPNIHRHLYTYFQASFGQHLRWGFHRPIVCFPHALSLATFFVWTSLLAVALWKTGRLRPILGMSPTFYAFLPILGVATSMSLGPYGLLLGGLGMMWLWQRRRWQVVLIGPMLFAAIWMGGRYTDYTDGEWLASPFTYIAEDRAASLQYRIDAETLLIERAKERPIFGWGGWGRNRIIDDRGRDAVITDGLWIIFLGTYGLFGLIAFYVYWCWPLVVCMNPRAERAVDLVLAALLVGVALQAVNFLFNGFLCPPLSLMHGSALTLLESARRSHAARYSTGYRRPVVRSRAIQAVPVPTTRMIRW